MVGFQASFARRLILYRRMPPPTRRKYCSPRIGRFLRTRRFQRIWASHPQSKFLFCMVASGGTLQFHIAVNKTKDAACIFFKGALILCTTEAGVPRIEPSPADGETSRGDSCL